MLAPLPAQIIIKDRCTHDLLFEGVTCWATMNQSALTNFILWAMNRNEAGHERNPQGGSWAKGDTTDAEGDGRSGNVVIGSATVLRLTLYRRDPRI